MRLTPQITLWWWRRPRDRRTHVCNIQLHWTVSLVLVCVSIGISQAALSIQHLGEEEADRFWLHTAEVYLRHSLAYTIDRARQCNSTHEPSFVAQCPVLVASYGSHIYFDEPCEPLHLKTGSLFTISCRWISRILEPLVEPTIEWPANVADIIDEAVRFKLDKSDLRGTVAT